MSGMKGLYSRLSLVSRRVYCFFNHEYGTDKYHGSTSHADSESETVVAGAVSRGDAVQTFQPAHGGGVLAVGGAVSEVPSVSRPLTPTLSPGGGEGGAKGGGFIRGICRRRRWGSFFRIWR